MIDLTDARHHADDNDELLAYIRRAIERNRPMDRALPPITAISGDVDEAQRRLVLARRRVVRGVAPAGSGKTQTIVNRALQRIREGMAPERILLLTFDKAAVSALTSRIATASPPLRGVLKPTTLNAFGYRILREFAPSSYLPVAGSFDQYRALAEAREVHRTYLQGHASLIE